MKLTTEKYELLQGHLDNTLTDEQKTLFEALLESDPNLRHELALEIKFREKVQEINQHNEIKAQVRGIHQKLVAEGKIKYPSKTEIVFLNIYHNPNFVRYASGFAAALLIVFGLAFWRNNLVTNQDIVVNKMPQDTSAHNYGHVGIAMRQSANYVIRKNIDSDKVVPQRSEPIYASDNSATAILKEFYQPYGFNDNVSDPFKEVANKYQQQNWQTAISALAKIDTVALSENDKTTYFFYQGIISLATENTQEAMEALEKAVQLNGNLVDDANWYLGLTYLQKGYQNDAKVVFYKLAKLKNSIYNKKATQILSKLK